MKIERVNCKQDLFKHNNTIEQFIEKYILDKYEYIVSSIDVQRTINRILNNESYICIDDKNKISGFIIVYEHNEYEEEIEELEGFKDIEISYNSSIAGELLITHIKKLYSNIMYCTDDYDSFITKHLTYQTSSIDLLGIAYDRIYLDKDKDFLNNLIKTRYNNKIKSNLNNFNLNNIVYEVVKAEDLYKDIKNSVSGFKIEVNLYTKTFMGFYFFSPKLLPYYKKDNTKYLVAKYNNMIIGVIKYSCYDSLYEKDIVFQSIDFIDVHSQFKNKGVATELIKELNKNIERDIPLVNTPFTEEGARCNLSRIFKEEINNTLYFENEKEFNIYLYA